MGMVTPWLLAEHDRFALLHGDYRLDHMLFDRDTITAVLQLQRQRR
jgi:aminoglycoside phosphotransferase (APT) family kinase protein